VKSFASILLLIVALARAAGATFTEPFSTEPTAWQVWNPGAFQWNSEAQNLAVTWDSRQTNALFFYKLPMTLTRQDDFEVEFTVRFDDLTLGIDPAKASTFPICIGFLNLREAMRSNYFRGSGVNSTTGARSIVEFSYFPDSGFGATVGTEIVSTNNQFAYSHTFPVEFTVSEIYRVKMSFDAATQVLSTEILHDGQPYGEPPNNTIRSLIYTSNFGDFALDAFSVTTYNDAGQSPPQFAGSILAHGIVDDVVITWPDPPIKMVEGFRKGGQWVVRFDGMEGWSYILERTTDFQNWTEIAGGSGVSELADDNPPAELAYYRVSAIRP
jgi:hypothetical protein